MVIGDGDSDGWEDGMMAGDALMVMMGMGSGDGGNGDG